VVIHSLSTPTRTVLAAVVLSTASNVANAGFISNTPGPFLGSTVDLQAGGGVLVPVPGVGPGGITLYANNFYINNFSGQSSVTSGGNTFETYDATLSATC